MVGHLLQFGGQTESCSGVAEVDWWAALVGSTADRVEVGLEAVRLVALAYGAATLFAQLGIESMTTYPDKISVTTWSGAFSQSVPRYESSNRRMDRHIATCADAQQPREINFKFV